jgi:predicted regulator of Ras-like GTPase activity (Roadblock/LC7/MglB family)
MENFLKQIKTVSGVLGCLVCDEHGHLLSHLFPSLFDEEVLNTATNYVLQNIPGLQDFTGSVKMIDFRYKSGRIVIKPIIGGCIFIFCESTMSLQTLIIQMNIVIKQIEKTIHGVQAAPPQTALASKAFSPSPMSPQELLEQGPLSANFQGMQTTLAKYLGPMAKIIFLECLEKWLKSHQPVKAKLPQLVEIVAAEIGTPDKMAEYRQKVASFL